MKEVIFTKKIKLFPLGDKDEVDRVYNYLRDAIYKQYCVLNMYMSQLATLYYQCDKNIYSSEYKEGENRICRVSDNPIDCEQPKGLGMFSNASYRVKKDLRTAHKNGLRKGEASVPYYKKTYPLLTKGSMLKFYSFTENNKTIYAIKWINNINFKVIVGSQGKKDYYLMNTLDRLTNNDDKYKVCGSSISLDEHDITLNLSIKKEFDDSYEFVKNRVMGVTMGYNIPVKCVFSDSDKEYSVGDNEGFINKKNDMKCQRKRLQKELKASPGGHGRKKKFEKFDNFKKQERNFARYHNHILSKKIVNIAQKNKAECIIIEHVDKKMLKENPPFLSNWSYYELVNFVNYKAERIGIKVLSGKDIKTDVCYKCGEKINKEENLTTVDETEWSKIITCTCPKCNNVSKYDYNKAKILSFNKDKIEEMEKEKNKKQKKPSSEK